jgi:hypothetical protein
MRELKLRPFKGRFSTNRLPITVLTDASEVLSRRRVPLHRDGFRGATDGQREIQPRPLVHFDHDTILVNGLKADGFDCDVVRARQQGGDAILALLV